MGGDRGGEAERNKNAQVAGAESAAPAAANTVKRLIVGSPVSLALLGDMFAKVVGIVPPPGVTIVGRVSVVPGDGVTRFTALLNASGAWNSRRGGIGGG